MWTSDVYQLFVFQDLQRDNKVTFYIALLCGMLEYDVVSFDLWFNPVSSLSHRVQFLLPNKHGVCHGHYGL